MGYKSIHIIRVVTLARLLGIWAIALGIAVVVWALTALPWNEAKRTPADLHESTVFNDSAAPVQEEPLGFAQPEHSPTAAAPITIVVDTHDSRAASREITSAILYYILPGAVLLLTAWRMDRRDLWAVLLTEYLSLGFLGVFVLELVCLFGIELPLFEAPFLTEALLRPLGIPLFVLCLNALPDIRDEFRNRRRRAAKPAVSPTGQMRLPPRPGQTRVAPIAASK